MIFTSKEYIQLLLTSRDAETMHRALFISPDQTHISVSQI